MLMSASRFRKPALVTISLTDEAKGMLTKAWKQKTAHMKDSLVCLSSEDKKELARILTLLVDNADKANEK